MQQYKVLCNRCFNGDVCNHSMITTIRNQLVIHVTGKLENLIQNLYACYTIITKSSDEVEGCICGVGHIDNCKLSVNEHSSFRCDKAIHIPTASEILEMIGRLQEGYDCFRALSSAKRVLAFQSVGLMSYMDTIDPQKVLCKYCFDNRPCKKQNKTRQGQFIVHTNTLLPGAKLLLATLNLKSDLTRETITCQCSSKNFANCRATDHTYFECVGNLYVPTQQESYTIIGKTVSDLFSTKTPEEVTKLLAIKSA